MPDKNVRRIFIVRKFQLKFAAFVLLFMLLIGLVCGFIVYNSSMTVLVGKLSKVFPQHRLMAIVNELNLRLAAGFLLAIILITVATVIVSHRIAGPLVRIERSLQDIGKGNLSLSVKLRKTDELQDLAQQINDMTFSLKEKLKKPEQLTAKSLTAVESIKAELTKSQPDIAQLKFLINELESGLNSAKEGFSEFTLN
jgi:signal transduction histidine kinase